MTIAIQINKNPNKTSILSLFLRFCGTQFKQSRTRHNKQNMQQQQQQQQEQQQQQQYFREFLSNINSNSNSFMVLLAIAIPIAIVLKMCNSNSFSIAIVHKKQLQDLFKAVILIFNEYQTILDHMDPFCTLLAQFQRQKPLCRKRRS